MEKMTTWFQEPTLLYHSHLFNRVSWNVYQYNDFVILKMHMLTNRVRRMFEKGPSKSISLLNLFLKFHKRQNFWLLCKSTIEYALWIRLWFDVNYILVFFKQDKTTQSVQDDLWKVPLANSHIFAKQCNRLTFLTLHRPLSCLNVFSYRKWVFISMKCFQ